MKSMSQNPSAKTDRELMQEKLAALSQPNLPPPSLISRIPRWVRRCIEMLLMLGAFLFLIFQFHVTRQSVISAALAEHAPIRFLGPLTTDKETYAPGDTIKFEYRRVTEFDSNQGPLFIVSLDSFENLDNGEVYSGATIGRLIEEPGDVQRTAIRRIPPELSQGTYEFRGWMQAQTPHRTRPVPYRSVKFEVTAAVPTPPPAAPGIYFR